MEVLLVIFEMSSKFFNFLGENSHLELRRACIGCVSLEGLSDARLLLGRESHRR